MLEADVVGKTALFPPNANRCTKKASFIVSREIP